MGIDFDALKDKAEDLIEGNEDKVSAAVDKVADVVADKVGHEEQVDKAADKLQGLIADIAKPG